MSINRYEELRQQQQVLPNDVIEKAVRLHRIFKNFIRRRRAPGENDLSDVAQATGMIFFYRFYEQQPNISPKDYALYAISCLHLATKVCECPIPITKFTNIIYQVTGDVRSQLQEVFETLDGIKITSNLTDFVELNEKLLKSEMFTIVTLGFNFDVVKPHDLLEPYIEKILKWHMKTDSVFFRPLKNELIEHCAFFLNDLQITSIFYLYKPELLAISIINMSFKMLKLPLKSPAGNSWYFFLAPNIVDSEVVTVINDVNNFFSELFDKLKRQPFSERRTKIPDDVMETWINYPYIPFKNTPLCPPPPLSMIDDFVKDSNSFKQSELDHTPPFPPPSQNPINPNLAQFHSEFPVAKSKKKRDNESKKQKNKNKNNSSRHSKHLHGDHMRGSREEPFSPQRGSLSPQHRGISRNRDPNIGHHHRHESPDFSRRFDNEYDIDLDYGYPPPSYGGPIHSQSDRREPRRRPREPERGASGSQPRGRDRFIEDDFYGYYPYDDREFKRLSPLPPQKRRMRGQEPRPYPLPNSPPRDRDRDRLPDRDKERDRFPEREKERDRFPDRERGRDRERDLPPKMREKDYNESPRFFKGPHARYRDDERDRDRNRGGDKGKNKDKNKDKDDSKNKDSNRFNDKNKGSNSANDKISTEIKSNSKDTESTKKSQKDQS